MTVNACIVTFPLSEAGSVPLSNLVKLVSVLSQRVYVVSGGKALETLKTGSNVQIVKVAHRTSSGLILRIVNYVHTQIKILNRVIQASRQTDLFIFFIGGENLTLPMLALKFLRKKVILMFGEIAAKGYQARDFSLSGISSLLTNLNSDLADRIILYSRMMIREANLTKYQNKIIIGHEHFVDFSKFSMRKATDERPNVVGYVGRLSAEKGILNLVDAMPLILKRKPNVHFMICGEGSLIGKVSENIKTDGLERMTKLRKWVAHDDVPRYLNELKLLVLPSFTEGLPNILLEAMACGTPVLATPAGAIPDVIRDGETGFLLTSNAPENISSKIVGLLSEQELLTEVGKNAYNWVRETFSREKTIRTWQEILNQVNIS